MGLCFIFLRVECTLVLWNFVLYIFLRVECALVLWKFMVYFSAYGTRSDIVEYCGIFSACVMLSGIMKFRVILSSYGTCSSTVEFYVIFSRLWNALWYFEVLCF